MVKKLVADGLVVHVRAKDMLTLLCDYGVSDVEAAEYLGVSPATVSRVRLGKQAPRSALTRKIFELLKEQSEYVFDLRASLVALIDDGTKHVVVH